MNQSSIIRTTVGEPNFYNPCLSQQFVAITELLPVEGLMVLMVYSIQTVLSNSQVVGLDVYLCTSSCPSTYYFVVLSHLNGTLYLISYKLKGLFHPEGT